MRRNQTGPSDDEEDEEWDEEDVNEYEESAVAKRGKGNNDAVDEEEEAEEEEEEEGGDGKSLDGGKAEKARGCDENLPPCKPAVAEILLPLPGHGGEKIAVSVRLSAVAPLPTAKKKRVHFGGEEEENDEDLEETEEAEEEDEEDGDGVQQRRRQQPKGQCPPWLPYLLNDDVFYWERTLQMMYGYAAAPPSDEGSKNDQHNEVAPNASAPGRQKDEDEGEDEDEGKDSDDNDDDNEDNEDMTDDMNLSSTRRRINSERAMVPSSIEDDAQAAALTNRISLRSTIQKLPPSIVLRFPDAHLLFFIVRAANGKKWYLLDNLPPQRKRKTGAAKKGKRTKLTMGVEDDDDEEEEGEEEEEDDEEEDDDEKQEGSDEQDKAEDENHGNGGDAGVPSAEHLDMGSVICIDGLMLAALQSSTALRCCLSQREAVSLACIEKWLYMDLQAALPLFSTIHRMMLSVHANVKPRLPYQLPATVMDFNLFFTPAYLNHRIAAYPRLQINIVTVDSLGSLDKDDALFLGEKRGIETMEALLKVNMLPSKLICLRHLSSVLGIRLLLWLLMEMPNELLAAWAAGDDGSGSKSRMGEGGDDAVGGNAAAADDDDDDDDDVEEEEEEDGRRDVFDSRAVASDFMQRVSEESEGREEWETSRFVPSPFLLAVVLEIRRRQLREEEGEAPSRFTLMECIGRALLQRVEDNKQRKDPLVVPEFSLIPTECSAGQALSTTSTRATTASSSIRQKLYQSDLVMLALVLFSTQVKRAVHSSSRKTMKSLTVRSRRGLSIGLPDAHHELFHYLLRKKAEKVRTPMELAESGYFRLLYLSLLRFKSTCSVHLLLSMTPLFTLLGPHDRCPFGELLRAWIIDRDPVNIEHLELFIDTFWNELHYRCHEEHFDEATLSRARTLLLLDRMQERRKAYVYTLQQLCSPSRGTNEVTSSKGLSAGDMFGSGVMREYTDEWRQKMERVRVMFDSLSMAPRTYLTPETLHSLLFNVRFRSALAVHYLMVCCRVVTVHANPLREVDVPAMEYALHCGDQLAVDMLLTIGMSLRDPLQLGNVVGDAWVCEAFAPREVSSMLGKWKQGVEKREVDPSLHYGILRSVPAVS